MSQNSGPFLVSSHGHPAYNPRLPSSSSSKRIGSSPISTSHSSSTSTGSNMNIPSIHPTMRSNNSMGSMKSSPINMNPLDKSNSLPYSSRYNTRKTWSMPRNFHDKNVRTHDEHESSYHRSGLVTHNIPSDSINKTPFTIEPSIDDNDEADEIYFSSRHIAAARFQRNQRCIHEIFNQVCIPDLRSNVSVDRILTLRRQVSALKTHRETFEKDLNDLEEKHLDKKRKFQELNEKFYNEYTEASSTNLTEEKINEILQKYESMEKQQKEKQLILQQQLQAQPQLPETVASVAQTQPLLSTITVSQPTTPVLTKTESTPAVETSEQQTSALLSTEHTQLPSSETVSTSIPSSHPISNPLPPSQAISTQLPTTQPIQSQTPPSQPQFSPKPSAMQQNPLSTHPQQSTPTPTSQGYPMMHPGSGYVSAPGYGHSQQVQYRPPMHQRSAQYSSNVPWQQQQQQQWQTNTYDPRYYNSYPPNVPWSQQQQQQWQTNQHQQQMGMASQMRGSHHHQQQPQMHPHYGYSGTTPTWNSGAHPSQQYGYPQNSSYDPSLVSAHPQQQQQQQYYSPSQSHNPSQSYEYGPPPQQPPQQIN
ncbi:unnamed protein product [Adineta steineri]|uniref:Uncharacterized protein n=1 Tax=Adineta steineri TaxID=433720 RepID=A0A818HZM3_9BILA|nr:unnamed protein product [Adineta steineri]